MTTTTALHSLRRVFHDGFSAQDIAEPLASYDGTARAKDVAESMQRKGYEVSGVRRDGSVVGFVERADLSDADCSDHLQAFADDNQVPHDAPLSDTIIALGVSKRVFVTMLGNVGGIITRTDVQKAPVRMWLFGMITLLEMRFSHLIEAVCPDDSWTAHLTETRLQKAHSLLAERTRRKQHVKLLDCLQLSDKGQVIAKNEKIRSLTRFESRRKLEKAFKDVERLRNNLAHSQDIISNDWETIFWLAENLDRVLEPSPQLRELLEQTD